MECEICGTGEAEYLIQVEGAKLQVCRDCSGSGKLIRGPPPRQHSSDSAPRQSLELEIADGYGLLIANARKKMGLPLEVLAERINEKHSFLERVEHQKTLPDEKLARKLERELGIRLLVSVVETEAPANNSQKGGMTLGDILEIEQKKKKKTGQ